MAVSPFSLLMAVLWSSVFILLLFCLRKSTRFLSITGVGPLLFLAGGIVLRCFFPVEIPYFTQVIGLRGVVASVFRVLKAPLGIGSFLVLDVIWLLWIVGTLLLLGRFAWRYWRFSRRLRAYEPLEEGEIWEAASKTARRLGVPSPKLIQTSSIDTPQVTGFFKPVVLLPVFPYTEEEQDYVLLHELTHWKNHDLWVKLCVELLCVCFWWNPLVYLLKKDLSRVLEMKCDAAILQGKSQEEASVYEEVLLKTLVFTQNSQKENFVPFTVLELASSDSKAVLQRIQLIMERKPRCQNKLALAALGLVFSLLLLVSYSFLIQPAYDPPSSEMSMGGQATVIDPSNTYLRDNKDGTYSLYQDGKEVEGDVEKEGAAVLLQQGFELRS